MKNTKIKHLKRFIYLAFIIIEFSTARSFAQTNDALYINIGEAKSQLSPLAVADFVNLGKKDVDSEHRRAREKIRSTIFNNFKLTSYFSQMPESSHPKNIKKTILRSEKIEKNGFSFEPWRLSGASYLVKMGTQLNGSELKVEVYAYHVAEQKLLFSKLYIGKAQDSDRLADAICNDFVEKLTGKKGIFDTKIVTSRTTTTGQKEIFLLDWDGKNETRISQHKSIAFSPAWSPDGKKIAYSAFIYHTRDKVRNADLLLYNMDTGSRKLLSYKRGTNSSASFFPTMDKIIFRLSRNSKSHLYTFNLTNSTMQPFARTKWSSMTVEPAISPDGKQVLFSSDRGGKPKIYIMNSNGTNLRALTHAGRYSSMPAWSPNGNLITFASSDENKNGTFDIYTIKPNGTHLKRLTSLKKSNGRWSNNESPSFSPDGQHILFSSDKDGKNQLYLMNLNGNNVQRITNNKFKYFSPKWSPYMP